MKNALEGIKVLDLTMNLPGPYMTWLMEQMGAEVTKVENPEIAKISPKFKNSPIRVTERSLRFITIVKKW